MNLTQYHPPIRRLQEDFARRLALQQQKYDEHPSAMSPDDAARLQMHLDYWNRVLTDARKRSAED